ncbi:unnamed protein product [Rotaria sp. Silwood1]|nr:unnamed protein product [Rotaria sp. Silwood1]CAF3749227.1 unnamed protein product [Rotaria sp. Silwood1]CAF4724720.1 unnamed protein product [Rotaria sp. Silwood1]
MANEKIDNLSQKLSLVAVTFGVIALVFTCVGISTPNWELSYTKTSVPSYSLSSTANFFYTCHFTNGSYEDCTSRTVNLMNYPRYLSSYPWMTDYYLRIQNAAGLCIVGILFLVFGTMTTLILAFIPLSTWINIIPSILLFFACLFMLAGMAEGSRYLLYNGYSANLYQAGHLFTILTLSLSSFTIGRIHFSRMKEKEVQTIARK